MSQFGMQMPGSQRTRKAGLNVYTGLMFFAVACLAAAVAFVFMAAQSVSLTDDPMSAFQVHQPDDRLP